MVEEEIISIKYKLRRKCLNIGDLISITNRIIWFWCMTEEVNSAVSNTTVLTPVFYLELF